MVSSSLAPFYRSFRLKFTVYYQFCSRYNARTFSSPAKPGVVEERQSSSTTSVDEIEAKINKEYVKRYSGNAPPPPISTTQNFSGKLSEKTKSSKNEKDKDKDSSKSSQQQQQRSTEFFYNNRTFKTKLRHFVWRFKDRLFYIRRYRFFIGYFTLMVAVLLSIFASVYVKYGSDMPATRWSYNLRKLTGTLKPEHYSAEDRIRAILEKSRKQREREEQMK